MANSKIAVTEGSGKNIATYSFTETDTKELQRVVLNDNTGAEKTSFNSVSAGDIAHDSADSGNPVKTGSKAITALSGATLVSSGDRTDDQSDLDGTKIFRMNGTIGDLVSGTASNTDGASFAVIPAQSAGIKVYLTDITIANTSASNIYCEIKDGALTKWFVPVPANGGATLHFTSPIAGTAATAWNCDPSGATTTVYASFAGFKSKI